MLTRRPTQFGWLIVLTAWFVITGSHAAEAEDPTPAALWADFNHYVRIARPDLAQAAGATLLKQVDDAQLLDTVEASDYKDYENTLQRATKVESLRATAQQLGQRIQDARIARSREPKRILADIQKLALGKRANFNATQRLKAAGQHAAPFLLDTLLDEQQQKLHSMVLAAMVEVGRPMVYPLAEALTHLEPVPLGQAAQVLAEIGYPQALPALKQVLENSRANPLTLSVVQSAYDRLARRATTVPAYATAAQLQLWLGWSQYNAQTKGITLPGYDSAEDVGLIWQYDREAGLVSITVPGKVYGDVLAMRTTQKALKLSPQMDSALSLWLMANLRRENNLPKGAKDPSYPSSMHPPSFYIEMAGPLRQHDVLNQALEDRDVDLALDAIKALAATAGTEALINREGTVQPLLRALAYPDRRIRFNAAFAMTNAQPQFSFPGSDLVVPVLAEAVRQSATRHAVVIANDTDTLNQLMATVRELGHQPIGGLALDDVATQINTLPSVDLIVVRHGTFRVESLIKQTAEDYRLASVPILAILGAADKIELTKRLGSKPRIFLANRNDSTETLGEIFKQASQANLGDTMGPEESNRFAITGLGLLRGIAFNRNSNVFNVRDAQPTLVQALDDPRQEIAARASGVLSLIDTPQAQRAIADTALDSTRSVSLRVAMLESLSESARFFGNYLTDIQLAKLLDLVKTGRGDLVIAAAQAHGSLTLPTSNLVQLIVE